jgi:hypothetical protein
MTYTNTTQKAAGAINTNGLHTDTNGANFPTPERQGKATSTLIAQLAIAGHSVHTGNAGGFTVCKYGMARQCQDLAELQAFARQLGVTQ